MAFHTSHRALESRFPASDPLRFPEVRILKLGQNTSRASLWEAALLWTQVLGTFQRQGRGAAGGARGTSHSDGRV